MAIIDAYPDLFTLSVDTLGYMGGQKARKALKHLAVERRDRDEGWSIVNALNQVQSRQSNDVAFLIRLHDSSSNTMTQLACIHGISTSFSDMLLHDVDGTRPAKTFGLRLIARALRISGSSGTKDSRELRAARSELKRLGAKLVRFTSTLLPTTPRGDSLD